MSHVESINEVSSEQLRVRKLQATASEPIAPLQPTPPLGFSRGSSIESAKPGIDPLFATPYTKKINPVHDQKHYFLVLLNMVNIAQEVLGHTIAHSTDRTNASLQEQHKLLEQRGKALEDELKANESVDWWSAATTVTGYLADVAMLALGTDAVKIAAAIGFLNRLANDFGITDKFIRYFFKSEETQAQVKDGLTYLAAAIRITSLIYMFTAAQIFPNNDAAKRQAMDWVNTVKNFAGMASIAVQAREKWAEWDHAYKKADILVLDGKLRMIQQRLQEAMRDAGEDPEILNNFLKMAQANIPQTM